MKITKILFEVPFEQINLNDEFFDSLRYSYSEFNIDLRRKLKKEGKQIVYFIVMTKLLLFFH